MKLSKLRLPEAVKVDGSFYRIHAGHPYWFRFAELLDNKKTTFGDFDFLYIGAKPANRRDGFNALFNFYYEKKELPRATDDGNTDKAIDYVIDADLIYSAVLQQYSIDLCDREIHWHKVRAMIAGLKDTKLNDIIYFRTCRYDSEQKDLMKAKTAWALPEKEEDASEDLKEFNDLLKK